jgi:hypothetical protein
METCQDYQPGPSRPGSSARTLRTPGDVVIKLFLFVTDPPVK